MILYMAIPYYEYEGYLKPEAIFTTREELEAHVKKVLTRHTEFFRVEIRNGACMYEEIYL